MIATLSSLADIPDDEPDKIDEFVDKIKDPVGTFYMYTLPNSQWKWRKKK